MKKILLLSFLLVGCHRWDKHHHNDNPVVNGPVLNLPPLIIGVVGQSLSHWTDPSGSTTENVSETGMITMNRDNLDWTSYFNPSSTEPATYGTAMIKLGDLLAKHSGRRIFFIFSSVGNTTSQQWATSLYQRTIDAKNFIHLDYDLILWTQGEGDPSTSIDAYKNNIKTMIDHWRANGITCPIYLALTTNANVPYPSPARTGEEELITEKVVLQGPDIDAMRHHGGWFLPDRTHPNAEGLIEQAQEWFDILKLVY